MLSTHSFFPINTLEATNFIAIWQASSINFTMNSTVLDAQFIGLADKIKCSTKFTFRKFPIHFKIHRSFGTTLKLGEIGKGEMPGFG